MESSRSFLSVDVSRNGKYICTTLKPNIVQLWITVENKITKIWETSIENVECAIFDSLKQRIFVGSSKEFVILNINGRLLCTFETPCKHLCTSRISGTFLGITYNDTLKIYKLRQNKSINSSDPVNEIYPRLEISIKTKNNCTCAAITDSGHYIIAGGSNSFVYVFSKNGVQERVIKHGEGPILGIAVNFYGTQICAISKTLLKVWSFEDNCLQYSFSSDKSTFTSITYSPTFHYGLLVLSTSNDGLFIYNARSGMLQRSHTSNVDGKIAFLGPTGKFIRLSSNNLITDSAEKITNFAYYKTNPYIHSLLGMAICPTNNFVYTIENKSNDLYTTNMHKIIPGAMVPILQEKRLPNILRGRNNTHRVKPEIIAIAVGSDGKMTFELYTRNIEICDLTGHAVNTIYAPREKNFSSFCLSFSKKYLAVIIKSKTLIIYDVSDVFNPTPIKEYPLNVKRVIDAESDREIIEERNEEIIEELQNTKISFDDNYIAVVINKSSVKILNNFETISLKFTFSDLDTPFTAFSRDNLHIFIGEFSGNFSKFSLHSGLLLVKFADMGNLQRFDLSITSKFICAANNDESIRIFDTETGKKVCTIDVENDLSPARGSVVLFSPDNRFICFLNNSCLYVYDNPCQYFSEPARHVFEKTLLFQEIETAYKKNPNVAIKDLFGLQFSNMTLRDFE